MSDTLLGLCALVVMFLLLFLRQPVWLALLVCGVVGNLILSSLSAVIQVSGTAALDSVSNYNLSVVPLFVLMGEIASNSRMSTELFRAARALTSGMRGGLAVAAVVASGGFSTICGSSIATAATMSRIALPEMRAAGYPNGYAAGAIAAGGTLGILIPPSIILVIYAAIAEQSVPRLFAASMIPGIVLLGLYVLVTVIAAPKDLAVVTGPREALRDRLAALLEAWPFLTLFVVTIGGIYTGLFSPTEAAAIGAFFAILLGVLRRQLGWASIIRSLKATIITSGILLTILIGATVFAQFVVQTRLPQALLEAADGLALPPWVVMALIVLVYLVLGCFLETIGSVLITVPIFLPVIVAYGYDPIWFGVLVVILAELGLLTPPVGMNLFIIKAQAPDIAMGELFLGIIPFLAAPLVMIAIMFALPAITSWLPALFYG